MLSPVLSWVPYLAGLLPQYAQHGCTMPTAALSAIAAVTLLQPAIPLGVYWPGEFTWQGTPDRWSRVASHLDMMQRGGVNCVWLTHLPPDEAAWFSTLAAQHGIAIVAQVYQTDGGVAWVRQQTQEQVTQSAQDVFTAWGKSPLPLAWGMCDEPRPDCMDELATFIGRWQIATGGDPVTTVAQWPNLEAASGKLACVQQACDVYPFFAPGAWSYVVPEWQAWRDSTRDCVAQNPVAWMMGQGFDDPFHVRPTPAQITWQVNAALAEGARGVFLFAWRYDQSVGGEQINGLTTVNGATTPQWTAAASAFTAVKKWQQVLSCCSPNAARDVAISGPALTPSSFASILTDDRGADFLFVVCGYEAAQDIAVLLDSCPAMVRDMATKQMILSQRSSGGRVLQLPAMTAGSARLFQLNQFLRCR